MVNKISAILAKKLLSNGNIEQEDEELYSYGFFILISQLIFFSIVILVGAAFSCLIKSIVFYASFRAIRKYAGGYHASTELRCEIMSTISIVACIAIIKLSEVYYFETLILSITALAALCVFVLCPLDTPDKPLTEKEFIYFQKISRLITIVIITAVIISYVFKINVLFVPCCLSLILESILLAAGSIKKHFKETVEN